MIDFIVTAVLVIFAILLAVDTFRKWKTTKLLWYGAAAVVFALAAFAAIVNWNDYIYTIILALILRIIGGMSSKRKP